MNFLSDKVKKIEDEGIFLGGPHNLFEDAGRKMLMLLLNEGMYPYSKVLDIGCGCLRGGYWIIRFLNKDSYYGIEPNSKMLFSGIKNLLNPDIAKTKAPTFDHNQDFDTSVFNTKFDYFLARSIWTHASKQQISKMLNEFNENTTEKGVFLTSYLNATTTIDDYSDSGWVGKSHESNEAGIVKHSFEWIENECMKKHLILHQIKDNIFDLKNNQRWLKVTKKILKN